MRLQHQLPEVFTTPRSYDKTTFIKNDLHDELKEYANKYGYKIGSVMEQSIIRGMIQLKNEKDEVRLNNGLDKMVYESNWSKKNLF